MGAGILLASFAIPGGIYIHLPIAILVVLGVFFLYQIRFQIKNTSSPTVFNRFVLIVAATLFLGGTILYSSVFEYAYRSFSAETEIKQFRDQLLQIENPSDLKTVGRMLRKNLLQLPANERKIGRNSPEMPPELRDLDPFSVTAFDHVLVAKFYINRFPESAMFYLLIFPDDHTPKQVAGVKIIDGVWLSEN